MKEKKTDQQIQQTKNERLMKGIDVWCGYFRSNPSRFIEFIIPGFKLRWFQKILLWAMAHNDMAYLIAARGLGKTYIVGLYAIYKCILFPGTKFLTASKTFKQGKEILLKITDDLMHRSSFLRNEITTWSTGQNDCFIKFKNGSWIRVTVAGESGRGQRSTVICIDESRLVDQKTVDTILRPMNASPRQPGYLNKPEYAHLKDREVPQEFYLSSAYYSQSEMFSKVKAYTANMLTPGLKYFVADLPYQLSIREGILLRQTIENEMSEATFSSISFMMEREGLFYGSSEDALFEFKTLTQCRILSEPIYKYEYYRNNTLKIPEKQKGEVRVLSVDVALLASKKHDNDASALIIHCGVPTSSNNYIDNISYIDAQEGLLTDELGLITMRTYYQYNCDYIALDANGIGQSIFDYLMTDRFDPMCNQTYGALDCINNPELSERCRVKGAPKVIFAIKAGSKYNNDMYLALRAGFQNGYINLLLSDDNIDDRLSKVRGYNKLSDNDKTILKLPYIQTSLLINELINLEHDNANGLIKVKERSGMRKDRCSSLGYGYMVLQELSKKLKPKHSEKNVMDFFSVRPARQASYF